MSLPAIRFQEQAADWRAGFVIDLDIECDAAVGRGQGLGRFRCSLA